MREWMEYEVRDTGTEARGNSLDIVDDRSDNAARRFQERSRHSSFPFPSFFHFFFFFLQTLILRLSFD